MSCASFLRASSSSASRASSVCTRQTRRCIFTGRRPPEAGRAGSSGMVGYSSTRRPRGAFRLLQQLGPVEDLVTVALLGKEQLAVVGEVLLPGVARHQGVEVR